MFFFLGVSFLSSPLAFHQARMSVLCNPFFLIAKRRRKNSKQRGGEMVERYKDWEIRRRLVEKGARKERREKGAGKFGGGKGGGILGC